MDGSVLSESVIIVRRRGSHVAPMHSASSTPRGGNTARYDLSAQANIPATRCGPAQEAPPTRPDESSFAAAPGHFPTSSLGMIHGSCSAALTHSLTYRSSNTVFMYSRAVGDTCAP